MRQKKNRKVAKKICLLFVLFFHSNSIRLLLWKWHTHTQERRQPAAFSSIFPFLLFRCFSFWFLLIFDGITNARAVTRGKFMCATHSQPRSKREKSRTAKKNLSNLLYFLLVLSWCVTVSRLSFRLSLLFLYKHFDAIHRHRLCNRNNMITSESGLSPALSARKK